ncbi:MAG: type II toxin-antitoxin system RelE/ParE family toxin [Rhodomicrobium sp.]
MGQVRLVKVRYTKSALKQLHTVLTYIQMHSPQGAQSVQERINELLSVLRTHPYIGARTSDPRIRRLAATPYPYVILYQVREDGVIVRSVRHGARKSH